MSVSIHLFYLLAYNLDFDLYLGMDGYLRLFGRTCAHNSLLIPASPLCLPFLSHLAG